MADFTRLNDGLTSLQAAIARELNEVAGTLQQLADVLAGDMTDQANVDAATALVEEATQQVSSIVPNTPAP